MPEIRVNPAKAKLQGGETVFALGGVNDPETVDLLGPNGIDAMWFEGEHGPVDYSHIGDLTRACDLWGMSSIVRVGWNEENLIYRTLDRGAQGIVVPHVKTRERAEHVVASAKFAPLGRRGMWTSRQGYGVPDYVKRANDQTMVIVLIEDYSALEQLDEIVRVEHIDVFLVAQSDFAQSMGHIGDLGHPEVQKAVTETLKRIVDSGRVAGTNVSTASVGTYLDLGVRFFYTNIGEWLHAGAQGFRAALGKT